MKLKFNALKFLVQVIRPWILYSEESFTKFSWHVLKSQVELYRVQNIIFRISQLNFRLVMPLCYGRVKNQY